MAITSLHLAKVLHTFSSSVAGQLPAKVGECLLVLNKVSQDWINCRHVVTGEEGMIPDSYLKEMTFKLREGEQEMFLAIADFSTGVEGDLEFKTGDLIIGERPINEEWWEGRRALQPLTVPLRMFPLTFVVEVSNDSSSQQPISSDNNSKQLEKQDDHVSQQTPPFIGKVLADFEARFDDELVLQCNEQVEVIAEIDENWYSGCKLIDGRRGIFPKTFVQFVSKKREAPRQQSTVAESEVPLYRTWRALHKEIFEEQPVSSLTTSSNGTGNTSHGSYSSDGSHRDNYQNVPQYAQPPPPSLPPVPEVSPVKPQPSPVPTVQDRQPSAYINFDEIFKEVQQSNARPSAAPEQRKPVAFDSSYLSPGNAAEKSKPAYSTFSSPPSSSQPQYQSPAYGSAYANPPQSNGSGFKYQPPAQVFDSKTLTQLSSSFSLDDIVRYEMQRAVVEKQPTPPSRPPQPSQCIKPPGPPNAITALDFDFLSSPSKTTFQQPQVQQSYSQQVPLTPIQAGTSSQLSSGASAIARPRPTTSVSPTPPSLPLLPPRSASMNFNEQQQHLGRLPNARSPIPPPAVVQTSPSNAQFLPAYKPERPPPVNMQQLNASKTQQADKRAKVIEELLSTEESYLADLELCCRVILNTPCPAVGAGFACQIAPGTSHPLLGNMSEVAGVSRRLLLALKTETAKAKDLQLIGSCFVKLANELETAYSRYCQHQPGANAFLARLNQVDATKAYVQKVTDIMKNERTSAFSLESILLKPVQRILKYPLLLAELVRNTGPQHPDTEALASASASLSKLTGRLNETRRRLDLVLKYRRSPSITARLSKAVTIHTIRKKTGRFSQRLSDSISFSSTISDEEFTKREQEFGATDRLFRQTVRLLQRWTEAYNEFSQAQRDLVSAVNEFTAGDVACPQFAVFRQHWSQAFDTGPTSTCVGKMNALAVDPLRQLVELFGGPTNVIKKRQDKLLDFRRLNSHQDPNNNNNNNKDELSIARTDFVAIDAQLTEELPSLCRFSYRILLLAFVSFFRHYSLIARSSALGLSSPTSSISASTNLMSNLRQLSVFSFVKPESGRKSPLAITVTTPTNGNSSKTSSTTDVMTPIAAQRQSISSSAASVIPSPIIDSSSVTTLRNTYAPSDLYVTCEPTVSRQMLELALPSGAVVGIVKRHDPTGQSDRWFVDTGVVKGFVPRRSLRQYTASPSVDAMLLNLLD